MHCGSSLSFLDRMAAAPVVPPLTDASFTAALRAELAEVANVTGHRYRRLTRAEFDPFFLTTTESQLRRGLLASRALVSTVAEALHKAAAGVALHAPAESLARRVVADAIRVFNDERHDYLLLAAGAISPAAVAAQLAAERSVAAATGGGAATPLLLLRERVCHSLQAYHSLFTAWCAPRFVGLTIAAATAQLAAAAAAAAPAPPAAAPAAPPLLLLTPALVAEAERGAGERADDTGAAAAAAAVAIAGAAAAAAPAAAAAAAAAADPAAAPAAAAAAVPPPAPLLTALEAARAAKAVAAAAWCVAVTAERAALHAARPLVVTTASLAAFVAAARTCCAQAGWPVDCTTYARLRAHATLGSDPHFDEHLEAAIEEGFATLGKRSTIVLLPPPRTAKRARVGVGA